MINVVEFLNSQPLLLVLAIISLGYFLGQVKIKGFSLESSAILFVALAAGHYGLKVPDIFRLLGLVLFIYSIGLQAGPRVSLLFKKEGMGLNILAFLIVTTGALLTILGILIFGFGRDISIGIFAGALTSTPGLASAYEATQSGITSIGYGIAYPIGVIGVILFIRLLPLILKTDIQQEERAELESRQQEQAPVVNRLIEISNPNVCEKPIRSLNIRRMTGCILSRLIRGDVVKVPYGDTILQAGDLVRVVGKEENIQGAVLLLGRLSAKEIPPGKLDMKRFVVTNRELVGKKIRDLNVRMKYEANITRIGRSGIDIPASPEFEIQWGDRVSVVAEHQWMDDLKAFFGDDIRKADEANVFSIFLGITLGILIGMIPVSIGRVFSFRMGITGGILVAGLLLSNRGRLGPIVWRIPFNIINFIRELGLIFFLCAVGTGAGENLLTVIEKNGLPMVLWGAVITLLPMCMMLFLSVKKYRLTIFQLFGLIPGGMTSTPGFAAAVSITQSQTPALIYAAVYPVAMLSMIVWAKILAAISF
jgi:putative transport protein